MTVLHLSIATSGLMKDSLAETSRQQPWIVRLAAQLCAMDGTVIDSFSCGIRAGDRKIDADASAIHGISSAMAARSGVDESFALSMVCGLKGKTKGDGSQRPDMPGLASNARYVVAWNADFLRQVIGSLFLRLGEPSGAWVRPGLTFISLQPMCAPWLRLTGADGAYRNPKRDEVAAFFLSADPRPLPHTTDSNLELEKRIYAALKDRNAFEEMAA